MNNNLNQNGGRNNNGYDADETKVMDALDPEKNAIYEKESSHTKLIMTGIVAILGVVAFLVISISLFLDGDKNPDKALINPVQTVPPIQSFDDCTANGGLIQETFPEKCVIFGETFNQSAEVACSLLPLEIAEANDICRELSPAYRAGEKTAEAYAKSKDGVKDFIDGFKDGKNSY